MKTSEAKKLIADMVAKKQLEYNPQKGLLLTSLAAGVSLESLAELSTEQASKIGQEYDSLFETRKRVQSLVKNGVDVATLRNLLAEIEAASGKVENAEDNQGQLLLPGNEAEPGTGGGDSTKGHTAAETENVSGENGTSDNIRESVNGGDNPGTSRRSRNGGGNS